MSLVHLTGEHAPEFKLCNVGLQCMDVLLDSIQRFLVAFLGRKLKQLAGVLQRARHVVQSADDLFEARTFPSKLLRTLRVVPDLRLFQLADDFRQSLILAIEVKDTP